MTKEIRANKLEQGDVYREFGDDETRVIKDIDWHGDRVLITTDEELETSHDTDEVVELVTRLDRGVLPRTCQHCERTVYRNFDLSWIDPEAGYDDEDGDGMWRETCDAHNAVTAEHEPSVA